MTQWVDVNPVVTRTAVDNFFPIRNITSAAIKLRVFTELTVWVIL